MKSPQKKNKKSANTPISIQPIPLNFFQELKTEKHYIYIFAIFIACLLIHFAFSLVGWSNTILGQHAFRQSQTAISTYYTIQEGFRLDYITPVLGKPWSIPMEFPLFQWLVALIVIIFKSPLDQTGRFVNLLFFYLCLFPMYLALGYFIQNRIYRLIFLCLVLLNPTYLFWSRTFMMESMALFFSLLFVAVLAKALETECQKYFWIAAISGILGCLVKFTTFAVFCFPATLFFFWFWIKKDHHRFSLNIIGKYLLYGFILIGIPVILGIIWTNYADQQKSLNPLAADFITSKHLMEWNLGTIQQRLSWNTWKQIFYHSIIFYNSLEKGFFKGISISNILLIISFVLLLISHRRREALLTLFFF